MSRLPEPFEFLDLHPDESATYLVSGYQDGTADIHPTRVTARHIRQHMDQRSLTEPPPAGTPITVEVPVLRLQAERQDSPSPLRYIDISSKTLRADLLARFMAGVRFPIVLKFTANGHAPRKRYSVEVLIGQGATA